MTFFLLDRPLRRAVDTLLAWAARRPAFRHALRRMVTQMPVANCLAAWLLARARADMIAVAARRFSGGEAGRGGFGDRERVAAAARALIERHRRHARLGREAE